MTEDYCKLVSGIILSTIWREDDHTRILWVTMLAVKDRKHRVMASVPGLAAVANLPVASVRASLVKLMEADPDSRTKDHDGRRISEIDGGWFILNGEKYRNFLSKAERNEYQAKLMAERRATERNGEKLAPVSKTLAVLAQTEAEAETEERDARGSSPLTPIFSYPTWEQVKAEAVRLLFPEDQALRFFKEMESVGWIDGMRRPLRNWKIYLSKKVDYWRDDEGKKKVKERLKAEQKAEKAASKPATTRTPKVEPIRGFDD